MFEVHGSRRERRFPYFYRITQNISLVSFLGSCAHESKVLVRISLEIAVAFARTRIAWKER